MSDRRVFISAGEISGDILAAELMTAMKRIAPVDFYGLGGIRMTEAGMTPITDDASILSTTGFVESVRYYYFKKLSNLKKAANFVLSEGIKNLIVVDNQGLSIPLAKKLKPHGVKVFYYVAPHVSIWGDWNAPKIAKIFDGMVTTLRADEEVYKRFTDKVFYAGNPVVDKIAAFTPAKDYLARHGLDPARPVFGLFPGSRRQEIDTLLSTMLDAAKLLIERRGAQIILPVSHPSYEQKIRAAIAAKGLDGKIVVTNGGAYDAMNAASVNIMASGTATLESVLFGKPPIICYKIAALTFMIGKAFVKKKMIGLPNILLDRVVFPELLQKEFNAERIASEVETWDLRTKDDSRERSEWDETFAEVRDIAGKPPVVASAAEYICERLAQ